MLKYLFTTRIRKNAKIRQKMRGENDNTGEYEGPVFPKSYSDLTYVSE